MSYNPKYRETRYRYTKDHYKQINLTIQKDYYENVLLPAVQDQNETVNGFIKAAISERIDRLKDQS